MTDAFGCGLGGKVNALHDGVGFENDFPGGIGPAQNRTIVPCPDHYLRIPRQTTDQPFNEFEFFHRSKLIRQSKMKQDKG